MSDMVRPFGVSRQTGYKWLVIRATASLPARGLVEALGVCLRQRTNNVLVHST